MAVYLSFVYSDTYNWDLWQC